MRTVWHEENETNNNKLTVVLNLIETRRNQARAFWPVEDSLVFCIDAREPAQHSTAVEQQTQLSTDPLPGTDNQVDTARTSISMSNVCSQQSSLFFYCLPKATIFLSFSY